MLFEGVHRTHYTYSASVFLEPHTIRLRPLSDPRQTIHSFSVALSPEPDGITEGLDVYGNDVHWAWFSGETASLDIVTSFVVESLRDNPYDYVVPTVEAARLFPSYPQDDWAALAPYMTPAADAPLGLAREVADEVGGELVPFLRNLAEKIHQRFETIVRPEGDPFTSAETMEAGKGSCRDLAVLYVEACRTQGVAARFVSGYAAGEPTERRELHAWGAAYIPGAGWRGFDPTMGLAVSDAHVTLAAAATPAGAAPVSGSFRGAGVRSELASVIELSTTKGPLERRA